MVLLVIALVVALWVLAVAWGRDSRDGHDWLTRASVGDPPPRLGD